MCLILGTSFILKMEAGQPELHLKMHKDVSMWEKAKNVQLVALNTLLSMRTLDVFLHCSQWG